VLDAVESKLNKERLELDSTKIYLDEARREKSKVRNFNFIVIIGLNPDFNISKVQEQLEMIHVEKAAVERSRFNVQAS